MTDDVKIIPFGEEKIDADILNTIKKILLFYLTNINSVMVECMKNIYCNPEIPQNNSIKFTTIKGTFGGVYDNNYGGYFKQLWRDNILRNLQDLMHDRIVECIDLFKDELPEYIEKIFHEQYNKLINDKVSIKNLYNEFTIALYDFYFYLEEKKMEKIIEKMKEQTIVK